MRHEVDVELVDADVLQRLELRLDLLGVADDAEAIADLVRDELAVLRADARVVVVVVELARLHVVGERLRHRAAVRAVPLDEIHDVIRDHRREPAHLVARVGEIVRDVTRRADDALELRRVATRLLGRAPRRVHDPRDDLRVGELDDDAVSDASGDAERLRPVAGHPHRDLGQLLAQLDEREPPRPRRVGKDGDAEAHHAVATYRGVASEASAARIPMTTKPMRPSPGSENVSPTSGVPTTITNDASALTKPTAAPGASGRAAAAPPNALANGSPAPGPTTADAAPD